MREAVPLILAFLLALLPGPAVIRSLGRLGARQHVRDDGPATHLAKQGTPTMGGLLMLGAVAVAVAFTGRLRPELIGLLGLTLLYGALGLADDYMMLRRGRSLGLKARHKLAAQAIIAALFLLSLPGIVRGLMPLSIPFTHSSLRLGYTYFPLALLFIIGTSNAANLTDGLDGLAAGLTLIAAGALGLYAYRLHDFSALTFALALVGACAGFLCFNIHPARIFMGDTGSLSLGAALAGLAIILRAELLLVLFGLPFYAEALSVVLQVISFRLTGKRIFRMSPLHHHFELSGFRETQIVYSAWAIALVLCAVTLLVSRLRMGV